MTKIYLIPGLGADSRIFNNIHLAQYDVTRVEWLSPGKVDTLRIYARKVIDHYKIEDGSIVIGNSLGGMIAIEIGKMLSLKKTILISSIKTINEAPRYFKFFQGVPLYNALPENFLRSLDFVMEKFFGAFKDEDAKLFQDMLSKWNIDDLKWAMKAALEWDNGVIPLNTYHIHGDKDLVFPCKTLDNAIIVKGGTHIMMYDMPAEINKILKEILNDEIAPVIPA